MQQSRPKILVVESGCSRGKAAMLSAVSELANQIILVEAAENIARVLDNRALAALAKPKPMIERPRLHAEKQKLSDKFMQPFETSRGSVLEAVVSFNGRNQKSKKHQKKRKKK